MILKPEHLFLKSTFSKDIVWRQRLDISFFSLFSTEKYKWTESQNQNGLKISVAHGLQILEQF